MIRITTKAVLWGNSEDEVLKAAVIKHGRNQWPRVASLLHHRSADQCKARWLEWLDPSIKKTEWSHAEDEKLLHMEKLMPTQWRTIAPIIQRTAAQCLGRYEFLLDHVQRKREGLPDTADHLRLFQSDQLENKPVRPGPIDMDDDDKREMISSVRARLLNSRSRKTDRKVREKQFEAARRLALLQKRRELHLAGVEVRHYFTKSSSVNCNEEIPSAKLPATDFYDTTNESFNSEKMYSDHRSEADDEGNAKLKRKKQEEEEDLPVVMTHDNGFEPIKKRSKLVLPAPQTTSLELEQVFQEQISINRTTATEPIMTDYHSALHINQISSIQDQASNQAHNFDALSNVQTSLSKLHFIQPVAKTQ